MESQNSQLLYPQFNDFFDLPIEENYEIEADQLNFPHLDYSTTSLPFSTIDELPFTPSMWLNDDDSTMPVELSPDQISLKLQEMESILDSEEISSHQSSIEAEDSERRSKTTNEIMSFDEGSTHNVPLVVPTETMEIDTDLSLNHLAKAYAEAKETGRIELAEVIARRIRDKVRLRPIGGIMERGLYYFFVFSDEQADILRLESLKNFGPAFELFHKVNPCGMVAHITANSVILGALPQDGESIHLNDFDMGEGLQWHLLIEFVGRQWQLLCVKPKIVLTSVKWGNENNEDTKSRLYDHARSFGLNLEVRDVGLMDLQSENRWTKERCGGREWLAFNCTVGLPHMARRRPRNQALEFLRIAKESIANNANSNCPSKNGVIIFADGDAWMNTENSSGFCRVFEKYIEHAMALMESIEMKVPGHLAEARLAMESLFLAPFISSADLSHKLEEIKERIDMDSGRGWKLSSKCFLEAKELVKEGETLYKVRSHRPNELILQWRETPLLKVSAWTS